MIETDKTKAMRTPAESTPVSLRCQLRATLRTRAALRQAMILSDILAPPLALRPARSPVSPSARLPGLMAMP